MSKSNADYAVECAQQLSRHDPQRSALIRMSMAIRDLQPQQRKPLTDEQIDEIVWNSARQHTLQGMAGRISISIGRAIEAAHGIKENA